MSFLFVLLCFFFFFFFNFVIGFNFLMRRVTLAVYFSHIEVSHFCLGPFPGLKNLPCFTDREGKT